jgi:dipeptidyl aminopeptidase/acylaminoacyl peptidase
VQVNLIEKMEISVDIMNSVKDIEKHKFRIETGAEAVFVRPANLDPSKTHPLLVLIHSGPFYYMTYDVFALFRTFLLHQGYQLLIVSYRGTTGFGEEFHNKLIGTIGDSEINDVGQLIIQAKEQFST